MNELPAQELAAHRTFFGVVQNPRKVRDDGDPCNCIGTVTHRRGRNVSQRGVRHGHHAAHYRYGCDGRIDSGLHTRTTKYPLSIDQAWLAKANPSTMNIVALVMVHGSRLQGALVGHVTPLPRSAPIAGSVIRTHYDLGGESSTLYAGYGESFDAPSHKPRFNVSQNLGYANMPLDGLWLARPIYTNGSVPRCVIC